MGDEIRLLGSGNAFHADGRGSACLYVDSKDIAPFLVDIGPTALAAIQRFELDPDAIERLYLTHLHGDHTAGWPFLLLNLTFVHRRRRPLEVVGPVGTADRLNGLAGLCYEGLSAHQEFEVRFRELPVLEQRLSGSQGGAALEVLPMQHHASSIGLRFELAAGRLAVSGDTAWCSNLERLLEPADLSFVECTSAAEPAIEGHLTLEMLRRRRSNLGRGRIVLQHLTDDVARRLAIDPIAGVEAGFDGMRVSIDSSQP